MKKNVSSQSIGAEMITAADGTAFTGAVSVFYTIDNGTQTAGGGTAPAHEGNGYHSYTPLQAETNGDHIAFTFTGTGAIPTTVQVYTSFPQTVDNNTILATLPTQTYLDGRTLASASYFDPTTDAVANVTTVATTTNLTNLPSIPANWITAAGITASALDNKGNWNIGKTGYTVSTVTDKTGYSLTQAFPANFADLAITVTTGQVTAGNMRGTDNALLAASYTVPDNASITAILADTNELQLNQGNWLTATGFSTLVATDIVSGGAITTSAGNANVNIVKINGVTLNGNGSTTPFDV